MELVINMPTIGNKKNYEKAAFEEMIYRQQLIASHAKTIGGLDHEFDEQDVEKEIKRRKK